MSLVALTVLAMTQAKLDPNYMIAARYLAGSLKPDTKAPGGFGESKNFPTKRTKLDPNKSELKISLLPNNFGITVNIFNGSRKDQWFRAADGTMLAWLEVDYKGAWKPIEYHQWYTCGNSFHQVVLPSTYEWSYERPLPKGNWKTKLRFAVMRETGMFYSDSVEVSIAPTRIKLNPAEASKNEFTMAGYPMVQPRRTSR
jgi:hypothetical protein